MRSRDFAIVLMDLSVKGDRVRDVLLLLFVTAMHLSPPAIVHAFRREDGE